MADLAVPPTEIIAMDDGSIAAAAADLERANADLEGQRHFADAQSRATALADRLSALAIRRDGIIGRRQSGDQRPGDGGELALIGANTDGLNAMRPATI